MTDDRVQFLRDRYDEEESEARAAQERTTTSRRMVQGEWIEYTIQPPEWRRSVWPPARVLREIEAKQAVLAEYEASAGSPDMFDVGRADGLGVALQHLTAVHSDHPNYLPEWRP